MSNKLLEQAGENRASWQVRGKNALHFQQGAVIRQLTQHKLVGHYINSAVEI